MLVLLLSLCLNAEMTAAELVAKSIAYHDPTNAWATFHGTLLCEETRPGKDPREVTLTMNLPAGDFIYEDRYDGHVYRRVLQDGQATGSLDGETDLSQAVLEENRLTPARVHWYFNYYRYLYGMPMNLLDPGTHLDPTVTLTTFQDESALAIRVTYAADVGSDIWYFYFHPESYALVGMRFYRDETETGGETIILDEEIAIGAMRLPKTRRWYMNADDRHLGDDILVGYRPPQ